MPAFRPLSLVALTLVAAPLAARAQAACDINDGSPYQVNSAKLYLNKAATNGPEKQAQLKNAVRVLTDNGANFANPAGRNYLLARALYEWARVSPYDSTLSAPRAAIGYAGKNDGVVDFPEAADSALKVVEAALPNCGAKTGQIRSFFFGQLYNRAVNLTNAGNIEAARALAARAAVVNPNSVGPFQLLAIAAEKSGDDQAMLSAYSTVLAKSSASDTSAARFRKTALYNSAVIYQKRAGMASAATKQSLTDSAVALFQMFAKEFPNDPNAAAGIAKAQLASGNAAAAQGVFRDMLAAPDKYSDVQLFEAGTNAEVAEQHEVAQQLLEAGLKKNPYYRDALYNLTNSYYGSKNGEKMLSTAQRLLQVDANSPQNFKLVAAAYQLRMRATTAPAAKKALQDSVLRYIELADKVKHVVQVNSFTHAAGGKHTVQGTINNAGTAAATYPVTVEFLDASGAVSASQNVSVGPVAAGATQPFTASVTQTGIVAYRVKVGG